MAKPQKPYCDKMLRHRDDYQDGELSPFLRSVVQKHLRSCAECRREFTLHRLAVRTIQQSTAPDVPPRLLKKVVKDLTEGGPGGTPISREALDRILKGLQTS